MWYFTTQQSLFASVFVQNHLLRYDIIVFFIILQDPCESLCHLQRCKGRLPADNYVLAKVIRNWSKSGNKDIQGSGHYLSEGGALENFSGFLP